MNKQNIAQKPREREALRRIAEVNQTGATQLDLSRLGLTSLPESIGSLTALRKLSVDNNELTSLPESIGNLTKLQILNVNNNELTSLPESIGNLTALQELNVENNKLTSLPESIGNLTKLQILNVNNNELTSLPESIGSLTALQELYVINNKLTSLPESIGSLTALRKLTVENNELTSLPESIGNLTALQQLWFYPNRLTSLPESIGNLTKLQILSVRDNELTSLPESIGNLIALQELYVINNKLTSLPESIGNLTALQHLYVNNNELTSLPESIGNLTKLQILSVDNHKLTVPPQEVLEQGVAAIRTYLRELAESRLKETDRPQPRYEAKLVLVGFGAAGKTCLVQRLCGNEPQAREDTTRGIEITTLPPLQHPTLPDVQMTLNAWDFAGQEIEHATHRFFLTDRSLYLVLWIPREGEEKQVEYWLRTIALHAPGAHVLLVATHADIKEPVASRLDIEAMRRAFAPDNPRGEHLHITGVHPIGNMSGVGIPELIEAIAREAQHVAGMGEPWKPQWRRAEQALLTLGEDTHAIPEAQFLDICRQNGVSDEEVCSFLSGYWHRLGKITYFPDDPHLKDAVVLKPNWVTKAISRVMNDTEGVGKANGKLLHAHLDSLWNYKDDKGNGPYARRDYDTFLRLMYRFELSYELPRRAPSAPEATLVPHHLPTQSPTDAPQPPLDDTPCVRMVYRFGFLPAALMGRIIVRTHHDVCQDFHWRNGVVLERDNHFARIEFGEDFGQDICTLTVWGVYPHNFFTMLIGIIDSILSDYKGMEKNLERRIPCPTPGCLGAFEYTSLVRKRQNPKHSGHVECDKCDTSYSLRELLEGIHNSSAPDIADTCQEILQHVVDIKEQNHTLEQQIEQMGQQILRWLIAPWNQNDTACPTLFKLYPAKPGGWREMLGTEVDLQLLCQNPARVHWQGKPYPYRFDALWWQKVCPILSTTVKVLKCVRVHLPLEIEDTEPFLLEAPEMHSHRGDHIEFMEHLIGEIEGAAQEKQRHEIPYLTPMEIPHEALSAFKAFLLAQGDPTFRGLTRVLVDGGVLWLCPKCREERARKAQG